MSDVERVAREPIVDPALYSEEYFLADNEGWREYKEGLDSHIHPKFARALAVGRPVPGERILDIGCGRGELLYYCARRGCEALGIDYSPAAVALSRRTIGMLPPEYRERARSEVGEITTYRFSGQFDCIFMVEALEHMHAWQLRQAMERIKGILAPDGRFIIMTPNYYYERYLSPLKRLLDIPFNVAKIPSRLLKDKYRQVGARGLLRKSVRLFPDRGDLNKAMHVYVTTPGSIRRLLEDFDATVRCEDSSRNALSLLAGRWWGRDIIAVARARKKSA